MESDPLSPSNSLDVQSSISDSVPNRNREELNNSTKEALSPVELLWKHSDAPGEVSTEPPISQILDFMCFVCGNEFDEMAKLHVHMSMKHKGVKVFLVKSFNLLFD